MQKVLVIDDEPLLIRSTELVLKVHGYECICATDGKQGIALAESEHPDIILLDIMMPDMDGWEVTSRLKSGKKTAHIPVIVLSGKEYAQGQRVAEKAGADGFVVKPFQIDQLTRVIRSLIGEES